MAGDQQEDNLIKVFQKILSLMCDGCFVLDTDGFAIGMDQKAASVVSFDKRADRVHFDTFLHPTPEHTRSELHAGLQTLQLRSLDGQCLEAECYTCACVLSPDALSLILGHDNHIFSQKPSAAEAVAERMYIRAMRVISRSGVDAVDTDCTQEQLLPVPSTATPENLSIPRLAEDQPDSAPITVDLHEPPVDMTTPLDIRDIDLVQQTFARVVVLGVDTFGSMLFMNAFQLAPQIVHLFPFKGDEEMAVSTRMKVHGGRVVSFMATAVSLLHDLDTLVPMLHSLGLRHVGRGVIPEHYDILVQAFIKSLGTALGQKMTQAVTNAYMKVFTIIKNTMVEKCNYQSLLPPELSRERSLLPIPEDPGQSPSRIPKIPANHQQSQDPCPSPSQRFSA